MPCAIRPNTPIKRTTRVLLAAHAGLISIAALNLAYLRVTRSQRMRPARMPRVSILVPARNEAKTLPRLLGSLLSQDYPQSDGAGGFEVIVVDDASDDDTWAVLQSFEDAHLHALRSNGPPAGWVGKNHALHTAAAAATGDVLLFLDADTCLTDAGALARLVERHAALGPDAVLSGLPRFTDRGPSLLLTGIVPFAAMSSLPLPLIRRSRSPLLSALNGQVWMAPAALYRRLAPHSTLRDRVLEDVEIGRQMKRAGVRVALRDLGGEVEVEMYTSFGEAWRGFRKNAYLLAGGRPAPFLVLNALYVALFVVAPRLDCRLLATTFVLKGITDRGGRLPWRLLPAATISLLLGALLQLDSARAHLWGGVEWKGRRVG